MTEEQSIGQNATFQVVVNSFDLTGSDQAPQFDDADQEAILRAMTPISSQAHDSVCELISEYPTGPKESRRGT